MPMKYYIWFLLFIFLIPAGSVKAQTISALVNSGGNLLVAANNRPPFTKIAAKALADNQKIF